MSVFTRFCPDFRRFTLLCFLFLASTGASLAAGEGGAYHEALPSYAEEVFGFGPKDAETGKSMISITNSMIMLWIVAGLIIFVAQAATRDVKLVPSGLQNFVEWIVESLYNFFAGLLGAKLAKQTFWFFGTVFILILFSNWAGLVPGVGTVGWMDVDGEGNPVPDGNAFQPFFRGVNADLNMTMAMSLVFFFMWFYWVIREIGFRNFVDHIFGVKGTFNGVMKVLMIVLFLFVGVIEMFSILVRPVALMFRLYGNIFAGENILETMLIVLPEHLAPWVNWLPALPFYFFELMVGFVQALVFALLTAVFLKLMTDHDDHGHDEGGHGHHSEAETTKPEPSTT